MLTWRENSHWQNFKKNTTLSLSLSLFLSLSLYAGRSADALVKLIFPEREVSLSLSLSTIYICKRVGSRSDSNQLRKNIWACDMKHAKLKIALILSNVRLCRTKANISKSVQIGFSSETFVSRSIDWPKHCIVLFHIQRNQANAGTKDHRVQALLSLSLSLSLSLLLRPASKVCKYFGSRRS